MLAKLINKILEIPGYKLIKTAEEKSRYLDIKDNVDFLNIYESCKMFTMTSIERMYTLYEATNFIIGKGLKGDFVECGVWKGGSAMMIAHLLVKNDIHDQKIFLYDTFEGMPRPSDSDVSPRGFSALNFFNEVSTGNDSSTWCLATLDEVRENLLSTGIGTDQLIFVKGKVEETIPDNLPKNSVSLLRLDTDWYSSTKHELVHLYPLLEEGGALIIDDFGAWEGAKKAVVEYFDSSKSIYLNRIDNTGRIGIKT
ncbi:MAG: TylF/MycF/NovP-related O-methyltransferase [Cyclobacteriaceae bacterium]